MVWFLRRRVRDVRVPGKVVVFGASSPVGQMLSLLLKTSPHVQELVCCNTSLDNDDDDVTGAQTRTTTSTMTAPVASVPLSGVVADLAHIDTTARVRAARTSDDWPEALHGAQLVLLCAGRNVDVRRRDYDVALQATAPALRPVVHAIAAHARTAVVGVACEPVNALVPLCAEWLRRAGVYDPRKLLGLTSLDVHRTRCLLARALHRNPYDLNVTVVGGRGGCAVCPLLAQTRLRLPLGTAERIVYAVQHTGQPHVAPPARHNDNKSSSSSSSSADVQTSRDEAHVSVSQRGDGNDNDVDEEAASTFASAVHTASYAYFDFAMSVLKGLRGDYGLTECVLVESTVRDETPFFASRVRLGRDGVDELLPLGTLSSLEDELVTRAAAAVARDVRSGLHYYAVTEGGGSSDSSRS